MSEAKLVVGVDGSEHSKAALRWALEEARLRKAGLICLHAWLFPSVVDPAGLASPLEANLFGGLRQNATALLERVIAEVLTPTDADIQITQSVVEGSAARALTTAAADADLLVVGSRGLGGFRGLLGSVSRQCAHRTNCPIVIVREPPSA